MRSYGRTASGILGGRDKKNDFAVGRTDIIMQHRVARASDIIVRRMTSENISREHRDEKAIITFIDRAPK